MIRTIVIRLVALLLIVNGIAGIAAAWAGWRATTSLLDSLRESSTLVADQQARLVATVRSVAVGVEDTSRATAGLSRSTAQVRVAIRDATQTATRLATTFDQLSHESQVNVFGIRPLEGMIEPFSTNAADFRQMAASLGATAESLRTNENEMARVSADLGTINQQVGATAAAVEGIQAGRFIEQGLASVELGGRLLLGMIFFEATLSALTGLALLLIPGRHAPRPVAAPVGAAASQDAASHGDRPAP
jgi:hypothetical protein